jgi:hypothetical protein
MSPDETPHVEPSSVLGASNPYPGESEVTFVGAVPASSVLGAFGPYHLIGPPVPFDSPQARAPSTIAPFTVFSPH